MYKNLTLPVPSLFSSLISGLALLSPYETVGIVHALIRRSLLQAQERNHYGHSSWSVSRRSVTGFWDGFLLTGVGDMPSCRVASLRVVMGDECLVGIEFEKRTGVGREEVFLFLLVYVSLLLCLSSPTSALQ